MSDDRFDSTETGGTRNEQIERELAARLERGQEPLVSDEDSEDLRQAAAWLTAAETTVGALADRVGPAPAPESVRDAVLARIAATGSREDTRETVPPSRSPRPRLPWWRTAAPVAVAASLVALFLWRENETLPTPAEVMIPEAESPVLELPVVERDDDALEDFADVATDRESFDAPASDSDGPLPTVDAGARQETAPSRLASDANDSPAVLGRAPASRVEERIAKSLDAAARRPETSAGAIQRITAEPRILTATMMHAEAETLLLRLNRLGPSAGARIPILRRLESLRPTLDDSTLTARVDAVLDTLDGR